MAAARNVFTPTAALSGKMSSSRPAHRGSPKDGYTPSELDLAQRASASSSVSDKSTEGENNSDDISSYWGKRPGFSTCSSNTSVDILSSGRLSPVVWKEALPALPALAEATLKASQSLERRQFQLSGHSSIEPNDALSLKDTSDGQAHGSEEINIHASVRSAESDPGLTVSNKDYFTLITPPDAVRTAEPSGRARSLLLSSQDDVISPIDHHIDHHNLPRPAPTRLSPAVNP